MGIIQDLKSLTGKQNDATSTQNPSTPASSKTVLVVEDELSLAEALSMALKNAGYSVVIANDGQAGLNVLSQQKPDLVLLDLSMPIMDGRTMLSKMRAMPDFATLPVIVLTNDGNVDNMHDTMTTNSAVDFLIKSNVHLQEIVTKVQNILH